MISDKQKRHYTSDSPEKPYGIGPPVPQQPAILIQDNNPYMKVEYQPPQKKAFIKPEAPMNTSSSNISQDPRMIQGCLNVPKEVIPTVPQNSDERVNSQNFGTNEDFLPNPHERIETTESCLTDT